MFFALYSIIFMIENIQQANYESFTSSPRKTKSRLRKMKKEISSSLDMSATIQLNESERQCRICLDTVQTDDNQLLSPCKCTGSVKYVHDKCYRQWIQRQYSQKNKKQQSQFLKKGVECELCKVKMSLIFTHKYVCCQGKFTRQFKQHPLVFFLFVLFFVINLGCTGFISYYVAQKPLDFRKQYINSMILLVAFAFLVFTALITGYYFIFDYVVEKIMVLQGYQQKKENKRYSRNQVIPQSIQNVQS